MHLLSCQVKIDPVWVWLFVKHTSDKLSLSSLLHLLAKLGYLFTLLHGAVHVNFTVMSSRKSIFLMWTIGKWIKFDPRTTGGWGRDCGTLTGSIGTTEIMSLNLGLRVREGISGVLKDRKRGEEEEETEEERIWKEGGRGKGESEEGAGEGEFSEARGHVNLGKM